MSLPSAFFDKVATTDCVIWTGAVNNKGYGCFGLNGVSQLAHRMVWEDTHGPIPDGMTVDHLCRVRNCVRPDHLDLVTLGENGLRAREAAGLVLGGECGNGHPLTAATTYAHPQGRLVCLACSRQHVLAYRTRLAAERGEIPTRVMREWAMEQGIPVALRGRLTSAVRQAFMAAHTELERSA